MKKALITGVTGQDGSYLSEFLISKGYDVHGTIRRSSTDFRERIAHLEGNPRFHLHYADMADSMSLMKVIMDVQPDEIYNLAAMSHVKVSFDTPEYTANADGIGTLRLLEAIRLLGLTEKTRIYQASTSELYGLVQEVPQSEKTPFYPRSPYACAKLYAYWITVNYREAYGMHASNGILFNHESPVRGETFVTRKITRAAARIALGMQEQTYLGNLGSTRDWGHAKDYVEAMWLILQQPRPDDYVIATGVTTSIREFLRMTFAELGITVGFSGEGIDEVGTIAAVDAAKFTEAVGEEYLAAIERRIGSRVASVDPRYFRPTEVEALIGDATKSRTVLGWTPKYDLPALVADMVESDIRLFKRDAYLRAGGFTVNSYFE